MAGYLIEVLTGKPYADAMETRVFQPLGMERTTLRPFIAMTYPLAQGHEESNGKCRVARPAADNAASWPAGSIFSNTTDLSRFVMAFLNDGRLGGKQVLSPKTIALLSSPHAPYPDSPDSYGYGLTIRKLRGVAVLEHGGSRLGYGSHIAMAPAQRVGVIVQTNRSGANLPATVEKALETMLPLEGHEEAKPKPALAVTAADLARNAGVYRNGDQRIEVVARDGRLFVKQRERETPLVKHSEMRYAAEGRAGGEFILVAGADGKTEYVCSGTRSYARAK
jgi:CubicO group peptidase (beta-lactamase class C family)